MRLLQLTKKIPYPPHDGESIAILSIALNFARLGNQVKILSMNTPKHPFDIEKIPQDVSSLVKFESVSVRNNINLFEAGLNLFESVPYHVKRFRSELYAAQLSQLLKENEFDIIQIEGLYLAQYIPLIKKMSKALIIYRSHNIEGRIWERLAKQKKGFQKWYLKKQSHKLLRYELQTLPDFDAIVTISQADEKFYAQHFDPQRIKFIPTGIDIGNYPAVNHVVDHHSLYYIGALDWMPNRDGIKWFAEEVFPGLNKTFPEISLHIAGRNAPQGFANAFPNGIVFHGEVDNAIDFAADKFICVVPLFAGSGLKIKIIEALASGKVVISTAIGAEGMPDGTGEFVFACQNAGEFSEKITGFMQHPSQAIQLGAKAAQFAKTHLDNAQLCGELIHFYETLKTQ